MPKKKPPSTTKRRTAWSDGDPVPSTAIVATTHIDGTTYQRKFIACGKDRCRKGCASGKPSHGPYWYAFKHDPNTGRTAWKYIGKHEPKITEIADAMTGAKK